MLETVLIYCYISSLKWPTLQHHRESARVVLLYKIINHIIQIPPNYFPTPSPVITNRLRNDMKLLHYQPTIDSFKYSFFQELSLSGTDCLPSDIVHADKLDSFKNLLYKFYNMQL